MGGKQKAPRHNKAKANNNAAPRASAAPGKASHVRHDNAMARPTSIADVARLFVGDNVKEKNAAVSSKRPRDSDSAKGRSAVPHAEKRPKKVRRTNAKDASTVTQGSSSSVPLEKRGRKQTSTEALAPAKKKPTTVKAAQQEGDDDEEDEEDVALSRAVQQQALSFLQRLDTKHSKAFWGYRDVAQGKGSNATTKAFASENAASPNAKIQATTNGKKAKKTLADDGEELWRVGGPYIPNDDEERAEAEESDSGAPLSASSSEPSWVTDSSEDGDRDDNDEVSPASDDDGDGDEDSDAAPQKARGGGRAATSASASKQNRGGRLFQGGDDIWDDDE